MSRNVVLMCLDTVRKDYFDFFAPRLQRISDISVRDCRAASSWSVPSHASMFTGELPSIHGIHAHNRDFEKLRPKDTFLSTLSGHERIGVSANAYASSAFGFDTLFDEFTSVSRRTPFPEGLNISEFGTDQDGADRYWTFLKAALGHSHPLKSLANGLSFKANQLNERLPIPNITDDGGSVVARETRRSVDAASEPFFLFVNFMDAHGPLHHIRGFNRKFHDAPYAWDSASEVSTWDINDNGNIEENKKSIRHLRGLYAAAIDYLDRLTVDLITDLQQRTNHETTVIITSDHGENLVYPDDHYLFEHTGSLTEGLLHVPLEILNPPNEFGALDARYVSQLRLGELVNELSHGENIDISEESIPAEVIGGNHFPDTGPTEYWDRAIRCAYRGRKKFLWDSLDNSREYRLSEEPSSQEQLAEDIEVPTWARDLFAEPITEMKQKAKQEQNDREIASGTERRLQDLGYM